MAVQSIPVYDEGLMRYFDLTLKLRMRQKESSVSSIYEINVCPLLHNINMRFYISVQKILQVAIEKWLYCSQMFVRVINDAKILIPGLLIDQILTHILAFADSDLLLSSSFFTTLCLNNPSRILNKTTEIMNLTVS